MKKPFVAVAAALALAACTTPTVYAPAASASAVGYSQIQLEANRWRVSFKGGTDADSRRAYDLALRRVAELTVQQGYDWFLVADRATDVAPGSGPSFSIGLGGGSFGRGGGVGGGVSTGLGGPGLQSSVTLEVIMGRGAKPSPAAYDARRALGVLVGAPI